MLSECDIAAGANEVVLTYYLPVHVVVRNPADGSGPAIDRVVVDDGARFDKSSRRGFARNDGGALLDPADPAVVEAIALIETETAAEWFGW